MQVVIINIFCRVCEGKNSGRHPHHHSFSKCWNGLLAEVLCRIFRTHHCNLKGPEYILLGSSNCWCGKAWNPIEQEGGEALLQQYRCSGQQVTDCLSLLLTSVPGQRRPQLSQLLPPHLVPAAERPHHSWDEGNSPADRID